MEKLKNKSRIKEKTNHFKSKNTIFIDCATNKMSKDNNVMPRFNKKNSNRVNRRHVIGEFPLDNYENCLACLSDSELEKKYKQTSKKGCLPDIVFESTQGSKDERKK